MKRVVLDLDEGSDPISGSIVGDGPDPGRFDGYMELIAALEVVRAGAAQFDRTHAKNALDPSSPTPEQSEQIRRRRTP